MGCEPVFARRYLLPDSCVPAPFAPQSERAGISSRRWRSISFMRRFVAPALCAVVVAVPVPAAHAVSAPDAAGDVAAKLAKKHLKKVERREARARKRAYASVPVPPQLEAIALCESGGDPTAVSSNGMYHGKYQFSVATWAAMGGSG